MCINPAGREARNLSLILRTYEEQKVKLAEQTKIRDSIGMELGWQDTDKLQCSGCLNHSCHLLRYKSQEHVASCPFNDVTPHNRVHLQYGNVEDDYEQR